MEKAGFEIDTIGNYANFMRYKGETYGIPTDGNVHVQFMRNDLMSDADNQKRFEDHARQEARVARDLGRRPAIDGVLPQSRRSEVWGSANLRNRANGVTWWYMYFYSAGGFPFDDDMNPTLNTDAGNYAVETYLKIKDVSHPEAPGWGTPQMIPRITQGNAFACQYWDGIIALAENPEKSKTTGQVALRPRARFGLLGQAGSTGRSPRPSARCWSITYSPRKEQAAYWALWMGTLGQQRRDRLGSCQYFPRSLAHRPHGFQPGRTRKPIRRAASKSVKTQTCRSPRHRST